jgi:hypothetical protein
MNTVVKAIVTIAVAAAAIVGVKYAMLELREPAAPAAATPPPEAQLGAELEKLRADAAAGRKEGMSESEALRATAADQAAQQLATQPVEDRKRTAANIFFGYYYLNTRLRAEYCRERGIDLTPFVSAFEAEHGAEHARARAIFAGSGANPEELVPLLQSQFRPVVEQDMKDVAASAQAPVEEACNLFNTNAQMLAKAIALPPPIKQALMEVP